MLFWFKILILKKLLDISFNLIDIITFVLIKYVLLLIVFSC